MNISEGWANPACANRQFMLAVGVGLLLELAVIGLLSPMFLEHPPAKVQSSVVKVSITQPPAPKPPPPAPKPPPPKPVVPPKPVPPPPKPVPTPVLPKPPPVPPRPVRHVVEHHVPPPPRPAPPRPVQPPPKPVVPVAPALPPAPSQGKMDAFRTAMRDAVQSVANQVYPEAAQMAHEIGAPEVTFIYQNGVVTDIVLAHSSGFPLLDEAAMRAARIAHYPPPPSGFVGRTYKVTIAVIFQMVATSDFDSD